MIKKSARRFLEKALSKAGYALVPEKNWKRLKEISAFSKSELSLTKILGKVLESKKIDCVFDVGANMGQFATMLRRDANYEGWIVSFEPLPELAGPLTKIAASDPKWEVVACALGKECGRKTLNRTEENVFSSFLEPDRNQPSKYSESNRVIDEVAVDVDTVDSLWGNYKDRLSVSRLFLKMDTQGYDLEVFNGASGSLAEIPAILSEISFSRIYDGAPTFSESLECFISSGFSPALFVPISFDSSGAAIEMDSIFVSHGDTVTSP